MATPSFESCVFINCPFDKEYEPILQAILFCIIYLDFNPRVATEQIDSGKVRLDKIKRLIKGSKYSIHDLSRCEATKEGEYFRLNMPFELGIDYGCREYSRGQCANKKILILEEKKFRYQATISDLSGCDVNIHNNDYELAVRKVRNWLVSESNINAKGARRILDAYADFQEWNYERLLAEGFDEDDIKDYSTNELLEAMRNWRSEGKPI